MLLLELPFCCRVKGENVNQGADTRKNFCDFFNAKKNI
jgi:hypothetical protein